MMSTEHSMSLPERVRAIARRAFPDAKALDALELDASVRSAWTQIAAAAGVGIHELQSNHTRVDREHWQPLLDWLETPHSHTDLSPEKQRFTA